ncbi:MAG TPA: hypothetical protein VFF04_06645 [Candidatus Babeliales bacterium]|nr:hypothetical protein [Candidatus Babeliales bacterium]
MNLKKTILILAITLGISSNSAFAHAGCSSHATHQAANPASSFWLTSSWQGYVVGAVVLGPVLHFWNEEGAAMLSRLKERYWGPSYAKCHSNRNIKKVNCCDHEHDELDLEEHN